MKQPQIVTSQLQQSRSTAFPNQHSIGGLDFRSKRALYSAEVKQVEADFGPKVRYSQFKVLTPEFLAPAVLLQSQDPASVFVMHKDLLEEKGRYYLSRYSEALKHDRPCLLCPRLVHPTALPHILPSDQTL